MINIRIYFSQLADDQLKFYMIESRWQGVATYSEFPSIYILLILNLLMKMLYSHHWNKCEMFARRVLFIDLLLKCMAKDFSVLNNGIVLIILHTGQFFNGCYSDELFFAYW
jgi:hypothetical protein